MSARSGQKHAAAPRRSAQSLAADAERVQHLFAPIVDAAGLHLEQVRLHGPTALRTLSVVVDLPEDRTGALSLDEVAALSGELSDALDADPDVVAGAVNLEVSSPGAERKLTEPRHWRRSIGRLVDVATTSGPALLGRLTVADDTGATLVPRLQGAKGTRPRDGEPVRIAYDTVASARVQVEFTSHDDDHPNDHETAAPGDADEEA